ncbi:S-adenosyl-L-methionine-dependent methyltransferase [Plectosphaerella cucumerina]|uniref:S-adenosyl-L-methionine-dependent methyltransferase n=1 Tax=Plectosphaerella cucumerina TaxID=40658 RepID=A0A8K0TID5_9PEZI|nr:S-adenosyl-L-methionine-dependent methyltransferase [Plectosphaerella cucumerina]
MAGSTSPKSPRSPKSQGSSPRATETEAAGPLGTALLEVDDNANDADSLADTDSLRSETTSLASSVAKYRIENGRRYHGYQDGAYSFPNDDTENERLDLQHNLMCLTFDGKLHISPAGVDKPLHRVLDAGTGTGIWALDFADEHPETQVLGNDLSPIQPSFVPPNLSFLVDDLEAPWAHGAKFDLIYARMLTGSLLDWGKFAQQSFDNLNPGGWFEIVDMGTPSSDDGSLPEDSFIMQWSKNMLKAASIIGRSLDTVAAQPEFLREAGFTNIQKAVYKWPINSWPKDPKYKEIGVWSHENMSGGLQAFSLALFTRVLNWSAEEVEIFIANVRKDLRNRSYHAYWPIVVTYGQKPEGASEPTAA